jgi:hypothetical protein
MFRWVCARVRQSDGISGSVRDKLGCMAADFTVRAPQALQLFGYHSIAVTAAPLSIQFEVDDHQQN